MNYKDYQYNFPLTTTLDHCTDRLEAIGPFMFDRKKYILSTHNINIEKKEETDSHYQGSLKFNDYNIITKETSLKCSDTVVHHTTTRPPYDPLYMQTPNMIQLEPWSLYSTFIEEYIKKSTAKFRQPSLSLFIGGAYQHEFPHDSFDRRYPQHYVEKDVLQETDPIGMQTQNAVASPTVAKLSIDSSCFLHNQEDDISRQRLVALSFTEKETANGNTIFSVDTNKVCSVDTVHGPEKVVAKRRAHKTALDRKYAARLKKQIELIQKKPPNQREQEETILLTQCEERRNKKNQREKERLVRKQSEMNRILAIPELDRSPEEIKNLETLLNAKNRKKELDRLRRSQIRRQTQCEINRILAIPEQDRCLEENEYLQTLLNKSKK